MTGERIHSRQNLSLSKLTRTYSCFFCKITKGKRMIMFSIATISAN